MNRTKASDAGGNARPAWRMAANPDAHTTSVTAIAAASEIRPGPPTAAASGKEAGAAPDIGAAPEPNSCVNVTAYFIRV